MTATPTSAATQVAELQTPLVLIDGQRLRRNIEGMQEHVSAAGAVLRPHFKTHRTTAIAELQLNAGAIGLTVATGAQLAAVRSTFDCPILVSSLLQADESLVRELRDACASGAVMFAIDSERSAAMLRGALGPELEPAVVIEIETGCKRTGVEPRDCAELAGAAARLGCRVVGLFSYPGHGYLPGRAHEASEQEQSALELGAAVLARAGFDPEHISAGSTPTIRYAKTGVVTEYRPGTYVFGDRQQLGLGAVTRDQVALTVVATVVAVHGDRLVLDAGGKALGRDAPSWLPGYGELIDHAGYDEHGGAFVTRLYDHHAVVEPYEGPSLAVGQRVSIMPNNANSAMALARSAWLTDDGSLAHDLVPRPDR